MDEMIAAVAGILVDVRGKTMASVTVECFKRRLNRFYWLVDPEGLGAEERLHDDPNLAVLMCTCWPHGRRRRRKHSFLIENKLEIVC